MLSYQHGYHAGCFADVVKHTALTCLLNYMVQKDKPLLYLDTHSGRGRYDLRDKQALKTGEARLGIELLWTQRKQLPSVFSSYLQAIRELNSPDALRYYPGSPEIALQKLRRQDRLFFAELHSGEWEYLAELPTQGKRVFCSNSDGIEQLQALLPPIERRGLIFIDPSYEVKTEYRTIVQSLKAAYQRFATGVYCLWYPIIDNKLHGQLIRGLTSMDTKNHLRAEFYLTKTATSGMTGCGLWIINPPYVLADELKTSLHALCKVFNPGVSSYLVEGK